METAAAALSRGLATTLSWADLIESARFFALQPEGLDSADETEFSSSHFAAARVLDGAAQFAPQNSPSQTREWGLWAAAAFAQTGNFPSSTVVSRRTFVRRRGHDAETAALLCAVAPSLAGGLRSDSDVAAYLSQFLKSGALADAEAVRLAWSAIEVSDKYPASLWELAQRGLEAALHLGTAQVLSETASPFPPGFVAKLAGRVPTLLPPQARALRRGFAAGNSNALVALAPGSGKTLMGELFIAGALGNGHGQGDGQAQPRWAVFVVPYVALGRGVAASLQAHFPDSVRLHRWLGSGRDAETDLSSGLHVVVATPERLDAYLRRHPESRSSLGAAVFDEAHLIGSGARGVRMEGLLARLKMNSSPVQLLLLSAALGDYESLAKWIEAKHVISSRWTPTSRRLAFWRPNGSLEWHAELSEGELAPLGKTHLPPPYPHIPATGVWPKMRENEPFTRENIGFLTQQLFEERGGPILCLCATRRATRELAQAISTHWPEASEVSGHRAKAIDLIEGRHRTLLPLVELLQKRVAWHNSSLPNEVRAAIEAGIAEGEIDVVVATSTLAEGVDLPFRLTVLADWIKWEEGGQKPISSALFRNISGRCGRSGAFTEGDTIVYDNPLGDEQFTAPSKRLLLQQKLYLSLQCEETSSALENLTGEEQERGEIESTFETQLLAALGEANGAFPAQFLEATFLAKRSPEAFEHWSARAHQMLSHWKQEGLLDETAALNERGEAWRATDLSPQTCRRLIGALETLPSGNYSGVAGLSRVNAHLWRALRGVPEAGGEIERFFKPRSRFVATPADLESLGAQWLRGASSESIFANLPKVKQANYKGIEAWVEGMSEDDDLAAEQWSAPYERWLDFVRAGLETWSPWVWRAGGLLAPLVGGAAAKIDWRSGAMLWEHGVDTVWAAQVLQAQAPGTRAVAAAVGRNWPFAMQCSAQDPLGLAMLQSEKGKSRAQAGIALALKEVGGRYCIAGKNLLELQAWLWAKAGLVK